LGQPHACGVVRNVCRDVSAPSAIEARDPKIKAAYEEVASGWFALAAQMDWVD